MKMERFRGKRQEIRPEKRSASGIGTVSHGMYTWNAWMIPWQKRPPQLWRRYAKMIILDTLSLTDGWGIMRL
jgi:hypothetical protein